LFPHVVQHHPAIERDRAQKRRQQGKVVRRQRRQESVEFWVLELPRNRRRAVWHRCAPALRRRPASPPRRSKRGENSLPIAPCVQPIDPPYQWGYVKKVPNAGCTPTFYALPGSRTRWVHTNILIPARQQDQMGMSGARRVGCGAVDFLTCRRSK